MRVSVARTSDSELEARNAPAPMESAPATATVIPAMSTVVAFPKAREEAADRAQDLHQAVVEAEEDVADALGAEPPLSSPDHEGVLVLELVLEDGAHRQAPAAPTPYWSHTRRYLRTP